MNPLRRLRRTLDQLTIYLPLFLFAILALGSWWLVRSVPLLALPGNNPQLRQDPDYRLDRFSVKSFDATGRMTREISGDSAVHFPATKSLHIDKIRIVAENKMGTRLSAQAQKGISLEAEKQVILSGGATAIRSADATNPRTELSGEKLTALLEEDRLVSDQPVRIQRAGNVFSGQSMDFDARNGHYVLEGRVKSVLAPGSRQP